MRRDQVMRVAAERQQAKLVELQNAVRVFQAGSARDVLTNVANGIDSSAMVGKAREALRELDGLWDMVPVTREAEDE